MNPKIDKVKSEIPPSKIKSNMSLQNSKVKQSKSTISTAAVEHTKSSNIPRKLGLIPPADKRFHLGKKAKTNADINSTGDSVQQKGTLAPKARPSTARISNSTTPSNTTILETKPKKYGIDKSRQNTNLENGLLQKKIKSYSEIKKKLTDTQSEFLKVYKELKEAQEKNNKTNGKDVNHNVDMVELFGITSDGDCKLLVKDKSMQNSKDVQNVKEIKISESTLKEIAPSLTEMQKKICDITEHNYKLYKEFSEEFGKIQDKVKIESQGDDNTNCWKDVMDKLKTTQNMIELNIKEQQNSIQNSFDALNVSIESEVNINKKSALEIDEQITQMKKSIELYKTKCDKLNSTLEGLKSAENTLLKDLRNQLAEKDNSIKQNEQKIKTTESSVKNSSEKNKTLESKLKIIKDGIAGKDKVLDKMKIETQILQTRIQTQEMLIKELNEATKSQQNFKQKFEIEKSKNEKLEKELTEMENNLNDLENEKKNTVLGAGDRSNCENQISHDNENLKISIDQLNTEKRSLEKIISNNDTEMLKIELIRAQEELSYIQKSNEVLRQSIQDLEEKLKIQVELSNELNEKIQAGSHLTSTSKELQNQLNTLRESECEKRREIEHLKCDLGKCKFQIRQHEETIFMHQRLLKIRSELINSLQQKEVTSRFKIDDLYSEVTRKTTVVNQKNLQMNNEMVAKTEEFQNLFSTLSAKQMELTRQDYIIKMLEENNERNQRLRVKQEEKISRLEYEISELKHIISIYQEKTPHIDFKKINANFLESKSKTDLCISTRDLYTSGRRKKRDIAIEVKTIKKY